MNTTIFSILLGITTLLTQTAFSEEALIAKCELSELRENQAAKPAVGALVMINGKIKLPLNSKDSVTLESKTYEIQTCQECFSNIWEIKATSYGYRSYYLPGGAIVIEGRKAKYVLDCTKAEKLDHYLLTPKNTIQLLESLNLAELSQSQACLIGSAKSAALYINRHHWQYHAEGHLGVKQSSAKVVPMGVAYTVEYSKCLEWEADSDIPSGGHCIKHEQEDRVTQIIPTCR